MPYGYLDHDADVGIEAVGKTAEEAFEEGARAVFNVMVNLEEFKEEKSVLVECKGGDLASLFVNWINALLSQVELEGIYFSNFNVKRIEEEGKTYLLEAEAYGEALDLDRHQIKTEVKACTYSGLKAEEKDQGFYVRCIIDV